MWVSLAFSRCWNNHVFFWFSHLGQLQLGVLHNSCESVKEKGNMKEGWNPCWTTGLLKSVLELQSICLRVMESVIWEITHPKPDLPSQPGGETLHFWKFGMWKQLIGFYIPISIWGGTRFIEAGVRLERGLQRGHQAVGRITLTSLQSVGLSLWGTGVTMWLVDLFQKPLDSKSKFKACIILCCIIYITYLSVTLPI